MPNSNYPNGFNNGLTVLGLPIQNMIAGNVFWVNSATGADSLGQSGSRDNPYATIGFVIEQNLVTATNGDVIMVAPNHSEAIAAGGITMDIAGVTILGLGEGNQTPQITFTDATSTWLITAIDCVVRNIVCIADANTTTAAFIIGAAGTTITGTVLDKIYFRDKSITDEHWLVNIKLADTTDNGNDDTWILNCRYSTEDTAATSLVDTAAKLARFRMVGCYFNTAATAGTMFANLTATDTHTAFWFSDNHVLSLNSTSTVNVLAEIGTGTVNTGYILRSTASHVDVATAVLIAATASFVIDECYSVGATVGAESAIGSILHPIADA